MPQEDQNPHFLQQRFSGLGKSPEVRKAAKRREKRTHEAVPRTTEALIQNYLNRFKDIVERVDSKEKERGIKALKKILTDQYVVRVEDIPERYWQTQMRVVRDRSFSGDWEDLPEEEKLKTKQEHLARTKEDQKGSLEEWIDYLASDASSSLSDALKYWAFHGMLRLERYEKGEKEKGTPGRFPERPTGRQRSVKMFPEVNERALRFIAQAYDAQAKGTGIHFRYDMPQEARSTFLDALKKKDFRSLYGWGQEYLPPISEEEMKITDGEWIPYPQGSDPTVLATSLRGKGSGWCIAGEQLARGYLSKGNLFVYYTRDREGNSTIPRVVIVEQGGRVTEVRGIAWEENVDDAIKGTNIIGEKLKTIPGGETFEETDRDTKTLTAIDRKTSAKEPLTQGELLFLYEIKRPIRYFGYKKDPRIGELRSKRNPDDDMLILFSDEHGPCRPDQIARRPDQIKEGTKAYIGPLLHYDEEGTIILIFRLLEHVPHIYTSFPEGHIRRESLTIGGKTAKELAEALDERDSQGNSRFPVSSYARSVLRSRDFQTIKQPEDLTLFRLSVRDLGFPNGATTDEIFDRAQKLGLELCPPEVGPHVRLQKINQPMNDWFYIGMKPITDSDGGPYVFGLARSDDGLWLHGYWAHPSDHWAPGLELVFSFRKSRKDS